MKLIELKCKNCGSKLKVAEDSTDIICQFCGANFKIDDEVVHHKIDDAEKTGYEMEKGRLRAKKEFEEEERFRKESEYYAKKRIIEEEQRKKNNLKWWIIGWIFCFPIPLTILIWRSKWEQKKKIIATAILWGFILIFGMLSPSEDTVEQNEKEPANNQTQVYKIDEFISKIDSLSDYSLVNKVEFNPQDKESPYYRVEYRLNAYKDSKGIHANINDDKTTIDIVNYYINSAANSSKIRIYVNVNNCEETNNIFKNIVKLFSNKVTEEEIDNYLSENAGVKTESDSFSFSDGINGYINNQSKCEIFIDE